MAATEITKVAIPHTNAGYNLTDSAAFSTLSTGAGNGVKFKFEDDLVVILKNDSGSSATYTLKAALGTAYTTYGASLTSPTIVVANGKTYLLRLDAVFKASDGYVYIECSVAGKVLVMDP